MICPHCRRAGDFALDPDYTGEGSDLGSVLEMHGLCRGGTWCDCQHLTEPCTEAALNAAIARQAA